MTFSQLVQRVRADVRAVEPKRYFTVEVEYCDHPTGTITLLYSIYVADFPHFVSSDPDTSYAMFADGCLRKLRGDDVVNLVDLELVDAHAVEIGGEG